jgi:hemerythrin-like domain-containing protein
MSPARTSSKAKPKPSQNSSPAAKGGAKAGRSSKQAKSQSRNQGRRGAPKGRIFDLLREEHRMAMEMLERICENGMDEDERREQFAEFRAMLMSHSLAEARAFYAPLKQSADEPDKVLEADVEHLVVERLLEDLSGNLLEEAQWLARAKVLRELIRHHVQEEEGALFQMAQQAFDQDELEEMAEDFESERGRLVEAVA